VLVHVALSTRWEAVNFSDALNAPALVWFGVAAAGALVVLVATSVWRLRLSYELWHAVHTVLAAVAVLGALVHVYFVDEYVSTLWKQLLWGLTSAAFVALLVWVRLIKPRAMRARPWRLERVGHERGQTTTLALRPPDGERFRFDPGQFACFAFDRSPFSLTLHPFSFSSSAESDEVEIAVKALGDFTSRVHELEPGTTVYVDGPHGVFRWIRTRDRASASSPAGWASQDCSACCAPWRTAATPGPWSSFTRTATGRASRFATSSSGSRSA
jgi:predicted ferric reductase